MGQREYHPKSNSSGFSSVITTSLTYYCSISLPSFPLPDPKIGCTLSVSLQLSLRFNLHGTMVVLLDLDDDDGAFDPFARPTSLPGLQTPSRYDDPYGTVTPDASRKSEDTRHGLPPPAAATDRPNPNLNHVFSTALACYLSLIHI